MSVSSPRTTESPSSSAERRSQMEAAQINAENSELVLRKIHANRDELVFEMQVRDEEGEAQDSETEITYEAHQDSTENGSFFFKSLLVIIKTPFARVLRQVLNHCRSWLKKHFVEERLVRFARLGLCISRRGLPFEPCYEEMRHLFSLSGPQCDPYRLLGNYTKMFYLPKCSCPDSHDPCCTLVDPYTLLEPCYEEMRHLLSLSGPQCDPYRLLGNYTKMFYLPKCSCSDSHDPCCTLVDPYTLLGDMRRLFEIPWVPNYSPDTLLDFYSVVLSPPDVAIEEAFTVLHPRFTELGSSWQFGRVFDAADKREKPVLAIMDPERLGGAVLSHNLHGCFTIAVEELSSRLEEAKEMQEKLGSDCRKEFEKLSKNWYNTWSVLADCSEYVDWLFDLVYKNRSNSLLFLYAKTSRALQKVDDGLKYPSKESDMKAAAALSELYREMPDVSQVAASIADVEHALTNFSTTWRTNMSQTITTRAAHLDLQHLIDEFVMEYLQIACDNKEMATNRKWSKFFDHYTFMLRRTLRLMKGVLPHLYEFQDAHERHLAVYGDALHKVASLSRYSAYYIRQRMQLIGTTMLLEVFDTEYALRRADHGDKKHKTRKGTNK